MAFPYHKKRLWALLIAPCALFLLFYRNTCRPPDNPAYLPRKVRQEMTGLFSGGNFGTETLKYFSTYGMDLVKATHRFGYFLHDSKKFAAHLFIPGNATEMVYIFHGYMAHTGYMTSLVKSLTEKGYAAALFDMEGHGLSDGARGDVRSFDDYSSAAAEFIRITRSDRFTTRHVIAHSAGCAVTSSLLLDKKIHFDSVTFASPLYMAGPPSGLVNILIDYISSVPRFKMHTSSDDAYLDLVNSADPLMIEVLPLHWKYALDEWACRTGAYHETGIPVTIVQGKKDSVLEWAENIPVFSRIFKVQEIFYIDGADHDLFNESDEIKEIVFARILNSISLR